MESTTFFPGAVRKVILGPPAMLLGANKSRRIRLAVKMPLTGEAVVGMPDWLSEAYTAVAKHFTHVDPQLKELIDMSINFSDVAPSKRLFDHPSAKAPSSELRGFTVLRVGESENPDVELHFQLYCSFAREFWVWSGEKAGDEVHMYFPATKTGVHVAAPKLPLDTPPDKAFVAERPELDPSHDAEFEGGIPADPKLEDDFGPGSAFENSVRESLVTSGRKSKSDPKGKANNAVKSKSTKSGARKSLSVN